MFFACRFQDINLILFSHEDKTNIPIKEKRIKRVKSTCISFITFVNYCFSFVDFKSSTWFYFNLKTKSNFKLLNIDDQDIASDLRTTIKKCDHQLERQISAKFIEFLSISTLFLYIGIYRRRRIKLNSNFEIRTLPQILKWWKKS